MNIQEIVERNTNEDGQIDWEAVEAEKAEAFVAIDDYNKATSERDEAIEESKGAWARAKAKYQTNEPQTNEPQSNLEENEVVKKLTEQVTKLTEAQMANENATKVNAWKNKAVAEGVPSEYVDNFVAVSGGNIEALEGMDLTAFKVAKPDDFGANGSVDPENKKTEQEAILAEFASL